ncbi:MAG: DNA polymerase domain-containing protein [Nanoarchaeota archaeon]
MSPETIDKKGVLDVGNGVRFKNHSVGLVPQVIMKYRNLRNMYKIQMKQAEKENNVKKHRLFKKKVHTTKVIANSVFGNIDNRGCRLYEPKISGSITYIGQETIKYTANQIEKISEQVKNNFNLSKLQHIYSDTDSVFIELGEEEIEYKTLIEIGTYIQQQLNKSYDEFALKYGIQKHYFNIQLEEDKLFSSLFFGVTNSGKEKRGAKKRYCGYKIMDGESMKELIAVGFEIRRSDSAPVAKQLQTEIFKIVLNKGSRDDILNYVKKVKTDLQTMKYKYDDFAIPRGVKMDVSEYKVKNPHVNGMVYAQKYLGFKFGQRKKVKLLYIKQMDARYPPTKELCYESEKQLEGLTFTIDWSRQMPPLIDNKVERVLSALGMESGTTTLEGWF